MEIDEPVSHLQHPGPKKSDGLLTILLRARWQQKVTLPYVVAPQAAYSVDPRLAHTRNAHGSQTFIASIRRKGKGSLHNYNHQCFLLFVEVFGIKSLILKPTLQTVAKTKKIRRILRRWAKWTFGDQFRQCLLVESFDAITSWNDVKEDQQWNRIKVL